MSDDDAALVATIGGAEVTGVRSITVVSDADGPDSLRLSARDADGTFLDTNGITLGTAIDVTGMPAGGEDPGPVFSGLVYALGFEDNADGLGTTTTVTAYDRSYQLYNGTHTRAFVQVSDVEVVKEIIKELGLSEGSVPATDTDPVHAQLNQLNETHFDFLARRAREVGRVLRVTGDVVDFVPLTQASEAPPAGGSRPSPLRLVHGGPNANLRRVAVRLSGARMASEVQVRSWDPVTRTPIEATVPVENRTGEVAGLTADQVGGALGARPYVVDDVPVATPAEATALAAAVAERLARGLLHVEAVADGHPKLIAGDAVGLDTPGSRFDGQLTLTRATHVWDASQGYRTHVTAGGGQDRVLAGLNGRPATSRGRSIPGPVVGTVTDVKDPDSRGRVRVSYPWAGPDAEGNPPVSDWVRVVQPGAGSGGGLQVQPEVNDEVLVAFDRGDPRMPYVLGSVWAGEAPVPRADLVDGDSGAVLGRLWRSRQGHEIALLDQGPVSEGGDVVDGVVIRVAKPEGGSGQGGGTTYPVTITLEASGQLTIDSDGPVDLATRDALTMTAKTISLTTTDSAAGVTVESAGPVDISSTGDKPVTIKGKPVQLNP